eukprot:GHRQ01023750.1.p2 GENE.GHRQ01023750.1~~GHRQ01023750.1.p2  ORF type:complete len:127 (+),score=17.58 GHRQ01023750.1:250-630(+)
MHHANILNSKNSTWAASVLSTAQLLHVCMLRLLRPTFASCFQCFDFVSHSTLHTSPPSDCASLPKALTCTSSKRSNCEPDKPQSTCVCVKESALQKLAVFHLHAAFAVNSLAYACRRFSPMAHRAS